MNNKMTVQFLLLVPIGHHGTRASVWPAAGYTAVSIPYFYPARPQKALPLKGELMFSAMFINSKVVF